MKRNHWIFAALACALCLGIGFGAGMLLAPRANLGQSPLPVNPMATAGSDASVSGADAPALGAGAPLLGASSASGDKTSAIADMIGNGDGDQRNSETDAFYYTAISGMENELRQYADRVQKVTNVEKDLRVLITELKDLAPNGDEKAEFPQEVFDDYAAIKTSIVSLNNSYNYEIKTSISVKPGDVLGSAEWQGVIGELESRRSQMHGFVEMEKSDLQNIYQDYMQSVQTLAGIQKQVYDDAMKVLEQYKQ